MASTAIPRPETRIVQRRRRLDWQQYLLWLLLGFGSVLMVGPFYWTIVTSFKSRAEVRAFPPTWWPNEPTLEHWIKLSNLNIGSFPIFYRNSLIVACSVTFLVLLTSALVGYVLAKHHFRGRDIIFLGVLSMMMIPFNISIIPLYALIVELGWSNTLWALIIPSAYSPFGIFLLRQFMLLGTTFGTLLGSVTWFNRIFMNWLTIAASIPSLLFIVIAYLALGLNDTAAILGAGLIVAPSITYNVWQGMKSLDPQLSEMARVFGVSRWTRLSRVILPQTLSFLFAAARFGLALSWKIMIFVELLGRSSGVGYRIQYWYQLFNMERVLASALPFIILMVLIELVVLRNLEKLLFRWRPQEAQ